MQGTNTVSQPISEEWKQNQKQQLTSEAFVEIEYDITDPDIPDSEMEEAENRSEDFSKQIYGSPSKLIATEYDDIGATNIENPQDQTKVTSYATLEPVRWKLDGSMVTVPGNGNDNSDASYAYCGYVSSAICNDNGDFDAASHPIVSIRFIGTDVNILPGLTIAWDPVYEEYATKYKITSYKGETERASKLVDTHNPKNNNFTTVAEFEMRDFNRVEIEILAWSNGNRRARIGKIFMGINKVYGKDKLLKFSCSESIDPISTSLPKYEIQFEVDNGERTYNPADPDNLTKSMMERQAVRTWYGYQLGDTVERIPGGVYYLSEWSAPQNGLSASFKARDLLGFLDATYYKGRFPDPTTETNGIPLKTLAEEVLNEADLPKDRNGGLLWNIPGLEDLLEDNDFKIQAPLPVCSLAECLQLIANAACCTIFFDRNGKLIIAPLSDSEPDLQIDRDHSYTNPEINLAKPVKQVDVTMFSYKSEGEKELYSQMLKLKKGTSEFFVEYSDVAKNVKVYIDEIWANTEYKTEQNCWTLNLKRKSDKEHGDAKKYDVRVYYYKTNSDDPENITTTKIEVYSKKENLAQDESLAYEIRYADLKKSDKLFVTINGLTIVGRDDYAKYCKLAINLENEGLVDCAVFIMGEVVKPVETIYSIKNTQANSEQSQMPKNPGETVPMKNNLITSNTHAEKVGNWLMETLKHRKYYNVDWRMDPRMDVGDIITLKNITSRKKDGTNFEEEELSTDVRVLSSSFSFGGAFKGKVEGMEYNNGSGGTNT